MLKGSNHLDSARGINAEYTLLVKKVATGPDVCQKTVFWSQYRIGEDIWEVLRETIQ